MLRLRNTDQDAWAVLAEHGALYDSDPVMIDSDGVARKVCPGGARGCWVAWAHYRMTGDFDGAKTIAASHCLDNGGACEFSRALSAWGQNMIGAIVTAGTLTRGQGTQGQMLRAGDEGVDLFRHVSPGELAELQKSGAFSAGRGTMEGKWFAESAEHAQRWGDVLNGGEGVVVTVRVPTSVANNMVRHEKLDGIGPARYAENLAELNQTMVGLRVVP